MSDIAPLLDHLDARRVQAHHRFLGDRLLEGRGVGSRGGRIAEAYIESVYRAAGLEPIADGGYRQAVPMIEMIPSPTLHFETEGHDPLHPTYRDDFVLEAGVPETSVSVDTEVVFCGYGIDAPEWEWDDFVGTDVRGKVLLIRVNDPGKEGDDDFFQGSALTYYGRWTYKFEEAARRGAAGVLLIHTTESAGYGWNVVRTSNTGPQYTLSGDPEFPLQIRGWVTEDLAREIVGADRFARLMEASDRPDFKPVPLGVTAVAEVQSQIREIDTANVVGLYPGSDPALSDQPIIFMSHHDHLGVSQLDGEDVIYPGAYDNASGVALILAMAEALASSGTQLRRPVLFLASTAEESGLLGSEWYARHALIPLSGTAAVLNVDGANLYGRTLDIAPLGVDRSSLGQLVRDAARGEMIEVADEQHPEQGMFFRQDHFPFARAGIPAIAFDHGLTYADRTEGWGEEMYRDFVANHYHQPTDELRDDFDYGGAVQQGRIMLRVAAAVADADSLPDWLPGASFTRPG